MFLDKASDTDHIQEEEALKSGSHPDQQDHLDPDQQDYVAKFGDNYLQPPGMEAMGEDPFPDRDSPDQERLYNVWLYIEQKMHN